MGDGEQQLAENTEQSRSLGLGGYLALVPSEPFRLFFPLGLLVSVAAVLLWPLFYAGWIDLYPMLPHSRLMISGFVAAFAIGFLGTAGPRLLEAPSFSKGEIVLLVAAYAVSVIAQFCNRTVLGDVAFLVMMIAFGLAMGIRVIYRTSQPPPAMLLAGMGVGCAIAGAFLVASESWVEVTSFRFRLARLLLHEGFILMPIMGIGGFLFPRFFGRKGEGTKGGMPWAGACGVAVVVSMLLDAGGNTLAGAVLRAVAAAAYILTTVPELYSGRGVGTFAWCLRAGMAATLVGLVAAAFFPAQRVGLDHMMFIAGYGLMVFTVGGRVLFGHGGELEKIRGKFVPMRWVLGLTLFAAGTRAVADFIPKIRVSHHIYAALLWLAIAMIWAVVCLPKVRKIDPDD